MRFRTDDTTTEADARELWPVHHSDVFGDMADQGTWRERVWDDHSSRDGFRLARGYDDERGLVGFATSEEADPARALYASDGWDVLGRGVGDGTVVMGKRSADRHQRHPGQGDGHPGVLDPQQPLP